MSAGQLRILKSRIKSVENTRKITRAMEMVSAAKLRRFQTLMIKARPYTHELEKILQNLAEAEQHMLRSIEIWPRSTGWLNVGQFYLEQGRYGEALEMLLKARTSVPERFALIHVRLGQTYDKLGQVAEARAEYQKYLELAPDAPDSSIVKGRLSMLGQ